MAISLMGTFRAPPYPIWKALPATMPFIILFSAIPFRHLCHSQMKEKGPFWIWSFVLLATIPALFGIADHLQGELRSAGVYGGIYNLSILMATSLPIATGLFLITRGLRTQIFLAALIASHFLALWYTATRAAFLAVLVSMGFWALRYFINYIRTRRNGILLKQGLIIATVPFILFSMIITSNDYRINPFFNQPTGRYATGEADLTTYRLDIIKDALRILNTDLSSGSYQNLLLGYGAFSRKRLVESIHISWQSDYLQVLMDSGLVGLILVILLYACFLRMARQKTGHPDPLMQAFAWTAFGYFLMSFLTLQVTGLFGSSVFVLLYSHLSLNQRAP
ncbi:MAG: hypothetical protein GXO78_03660 [Calditrichaeota bacterium]|nr:hypothetical protein [Calditrichota bacterium]